MRSTREREKKGNNNKEEVDGEFVLGEWVYRPSDEREFCFFICFFYFFSLLYIKI